MIDFKKLVEAGVHFGHQKTKWCPKMRPFIWGHRKGIHLIDVSKTAANLEKAAQFLKETAERNQPILWVGTKPAAKEIIQAAAINLQQPYINHRWVGGTLTNYSQVKKSVTKFLHYQDILNKAADFPYTKKELNIIRKTVDRLHNTIGGIVKLNWPIGALVVIDVKREATAIKEAVQAGIPVVALVDTNCDPSGITYVIPANDDSPRSIKLLVDYLANAVAEGKKNAKAVEPAMTEEQFVDETVVAADVELEDEEDAAARKAKKGSAEGEEKPKRPARRPAAKAKK